LRLPDDQRDGGRREERGHGGGELSEVVRAGQSPPESGHHDARGDRGGGDSGGVEQCVAGRVERQREQDGGDGGNTARY
jgi:hypothetical protein